MGRTIGVIILIQISTLGSAAASRPPTSSTRPAIRLIWADPLSILPDPTGVSEQVRMLFGNLGVDVEWQTYGVEAPRRERVEVHVVLWSGEPAAWDLGTRTMGVTFHNRRRAERVFAFFPVVARTLGWRPETLRKRLKHDSVITFERALSRVIAHEVVHAVQPQLEHAGFGITRNRLSADFLRAAKPNMEERAREQFLEALAAFPTQSDRSTNCQETFSRAEKRHVADPGSPTSP